MDWRKWHAGSGERGTRMEEVGRWLVGVRVVVVGVSQELDFELDDSASEWYAGSSVFAASSPALCKAQGTAGTVGSFSGAFLGLAF